MNVSVSILWTIYLNDPVDGRKIDTTSRNIRTEEHSVLFLDELEIDSCSLVLVLLTMQLHQVLTDL